MKDNFVIDNLSNGHDYLSDFQKKIYDQKSMCVFLKYLTDKKWAEYKDEGNNRHANRDVIQKNIEALKNMNPSDFIE